MSESRTGRDETLAEGEHEDPTPTAVAVPRSESPNSGSADPLPPGYRVDLATLRFEPGSAPPPPTAAGSEPGPFGAEDLPAPKPQPQL